MKLLITGSMKTLHRELASLLGSEYAIEYASDGVHALQLLRSFAPDVVLLDLQMPRLDGIAVLQQMRIEGLHAKVLAVLTVRSEYARQSLIRLEPDYVLIPPCAPFVVAARIVSLAPGTVPVPTGTQRKLADMLMLLGISPGSEGGRLLFHAILYKAEHPESLLTKDIYPALVTSRLSSDWKYAERNIRAAIAAAWKCRSDPVWVYYFPDSPNGKKPSNQTFISRLAQLLSLQDK